MSLQRRCRVLLSVLDVEDGDLEDVVVHGGQVRDIRETGVVLLGLVAEGGIRSLDVGRSLAAQHDADVVTEAPDLGDKTVDEGAVHGVGAELLIAARHERAVLSDEDEIVAVRAELPPQRRVLPAARGGERDPRVAEAIEHRPQRGRYGALPIEQSAVHIGRDQTDLTCPAGKSVGVDRKIGRSVRGVIGHSSILPEARTSSSRRCRCASSAGLVASSRARPNAPIAARCSPARASSSPWVAHHR